MAKTGWVESSPRHLFVAEFASDCIGQWLQSVQSDLNDFFKRNETNLHTTNSANLIQIKNILIRFLFRTPGVHPAHHVRTGLDYL